MKRVITLPQLSKAQQEIADSPALYKVCPSGRRWGKTYLGSTLVAKPALEGGLAWWVWPTHKMGRTGWKQLRRLGHQIAKGIEGVQIREGDRALVFPHGGEAQMRSAEDPESLVAEGLNRVVLDESGIIVRRAWAESLRPCLYDTGGDAFFFGTPKGRNWFYRAYLRGLDPLDTDWASWCYSSLDNPFIPDERKAQLIKEHEEGSYAEKYWQQEIMGQFIDDAGVVFRKVVEAATAEWQDKAIDGHDYVFGVDWGKHNDFTVIAVFDLQEAALVHLDRFNDIDYRLQTERLRGLAGRFEPVEILAESNSMGEPLIERLHEMDLPVTPFLTTNSTKNAAVEALALALENGDLRIVPDPELISELQAFEMSRTKTGKATYGAPSGIHDDTVMASVIGFTGASLDKQIGAAWG